MYKKRPAFLDKFLLTFHKIIDIIYLDRVSYANIPWGEPARKVFKTQMEQETRENNLMLQTLIVAAKQNDENAFEELLKRYTPLIESMTLQFVSSDASSQDREDLRQEAILGFYKALTRFDTEQNEVQFGLYAKECIRNRLISYMRTEKKRVRVFPLESGESVDIADAEQDPVNRLVEQENYLALYDRICSTLSPYENRVWWMYLSGRTASEIGKQLGKDARSVQNAVYRIRRKLRSVIPYS